MSEAQAVTIADFLLARIAEDEAEARKTVADRQRMYDRGEWVNPEGMNGPDTFLQSWEDHPGPVLIVGAERILAECEAKRRIVSMLQDATSQRMRMSQTEHEAWRVTRAAEVAYEDAARLLALPFADHTDYNPDWRP